MTGAYRRMPLKRTEPFPEDLHTALDYTKIPSCSVIATRPIFWLQIHDQNLTSVCEHAVTVSEILRFSFLFLILLVYTCVNLGKTMPPRAMQFQFTTPSWMNVKELFLSHMNVFNLIRSIDWVTAFHDRRLSPVASIADREKMFFSECFWKSLSLSFLHLPTVRISTGAQKFAAFLIAELPKPAAESSNCGLSIEGTCLHVE